MVEIEYKVHVGQIYGTKCKSLMHKLYVHAVVCQTHQLCFKPVTLAVIELQYPCLKELVSKLVTVYEIPLNKILKLCRRFL